MGSVESSPSGGWNTLVTDDPFNLERFVAAQSGTYEWALAELRQGNKTTHWMWFVFPQVTGLGLSDMAQRYGIGSLDEARAYLHHPLLGARLRTCAAVVAATTGRTAEQIFGGIDAVKLRSSMTLFMRAAPDDDVFATVLARYFN